jgi:ATP-dependent Clp protease ATP-binding subunit ClpC
LENFLIALIAVSAGLLVAYRERWWRRARPAAPVAAAAVVESLTARLHRLEGVFAPGASSLAHPRELEDQSAFAEAVGLLQSAEVSLDTVMQYANGANWALACVALAALRRRADGAAKADEVEAQFDKLYPWPMYFALTFFTGLEPRPPVGAPAAGAKDWWCDNQVIPVLFRDYFSERQRLGDSPQFGSSVHASYASPTATIKNFLRRINHPFSGELIRQLDNLQRTNIDRTFLISFGRFWADTGGAELLVEPVQWQDGLAAAQAALLNLPARPLLVCGEPGVGKTSFLRLLAGRLEELGWSVFEASGADLMAGQQWFGQLEGRIQRTIEELGVSKRLIWYIPDLLQMARSGTHQGQAASILDQILPAIVAGRLVAWTEATQKSTARLLQTRPTLRAAFELIRLEPQSPEETTELAHTLIARLSQEVGIAIEEECVDVALHSARQYLSAGNFPGPVLELIKSTAARALKGAVPVVKAHDVIATLAQLTGLPISILDHKERVDLATIRTYFSNRVIGQEEAVGAIVDRIAMLKAGLNDPGKPIGVFLFAGPTGTGKTELAKTVAEYLFGSPERLVRLDMSEYQTAEAAHKILGGGGVADDSDSLINRVRKQPFSVVLLDEFEKAHVGIWDLFLQVFDDGRLTDAMGHVADFRHCMIILTTNLGATAHGNSGLGFAPAVGAYSSGEVLRAISRTFRPEFQNRLDKVIIFHPLTRDLMREILKKELNRVLERRGLKYREWAVEWEASAQDFLLEKGFSADMGARPLKRAIDQYVIAPLAATIVEQRFPEGDQFVFVRSDGRAIQAEFVDPNSEDGLLPPRPHAGPPARPLALPEMILAPCGTEAEVLTLEREWMDLERTFLSESWEEGKARLLNTMLAADFWSRGDRHETLSRLALMDRVKTAMSTADSLRTRLAKGIERTGKHSRELVGRLALQLHLIGEGMRDVKEAAPIEVALQVEPAFERQADAQARRQWCLRLMGMYRAWAGNRHMQLAEVADPEGRRLPLLLISGFGAHRQLMGEVGLHVLESGEDERGPGRVAARVRLAVAPLGDLPADRLRAHLLNGLSTGSQPHTVVRRYRSDPSPLVRNMNGSWRSGKLDAVLGGDFDLIAQMGAASPSALARGTP